MITLGDSEELYRDEIATLQVSSIQGICKINRDKCNKYYGKVNTGTHILIKIHNYTRGIIRFVALKFLQG